MSLRQGFKPGTGGQIETIGDQPRRRESAASGLAVPAGTGAVLIGEVSQCNDDDTDNHFDPPMGRFPVIEEDEPPYRLLVNEYPPAPGV